MGHSNGVADVDVTDDDEAALTLTIDAASFSEGAGEGATTAKVSRNTDTSAALVVQLTSDDTSEATVPETVTIPAGQASVEFEIDAVDDAIVDGTQTVSIKAGADGHESDVDDVDVTDDDEAALTLTIDAASFSEGAGEGATTAKVSRNTDTSAALVVQLTSDDTSEATVPETVTIPAGQASVEFEIDAVDDAIVDGTQAVSIKAGADGHESDVDDVDVTDDDEAALTLTIDAASFSEGAGEGATTAKVSRNTDTSAALVVQLTSDDTSEATVPETVTIPAGQASVEFEIDAVDDAIVDGTQTVSIKAGADGHESDVDDVDVTDDDEAALTLTIDAASFSEGGGEGATTAKVSRNTDTSAALVVQLTSDDTSEATVPETVTIPAGQASVEFEIDAVDDAIVDGTQTVSIKAGADGHESDVDDVDVTDDDVPTLIVTIDEDAISENGGVALATVSRNDPADTNLVVALTSSDTSEAVVPETVVIPAGQLTSQPFEIKGVDDAILDGTVTVTITASSTNPHEPGSDVIDVTDDEVGRSEDSDLRVLGHSGGQGASR